MRSPFRVYLQQPAARRLLAGTLFVGLALSGCGGGGAEQERRTVHGQGFTFSAPADWQARRAIRQVSLAPKLGAPELVSVSVFRLVRPYRPSLWPRVVVELDRVANTLAAGLKGTLDTTSTVDVAGIRSRQYEISYRRGGKDLRERITFVLRARREYQLLCRWQTSAGEPAACGLLAETFRPA